MLPPVSGTPEKSFPEGFQGQKGKGGPHAALYQVCDQFHRCGGPSVEHSGHGGIACDHDGGSCGDAEKRGPFTDRSCDVAFGTLDDQSERSPERIAEKKIRQGCADAAGGRLDVNLIQVGEQAVIDFVKEKIANQAEEAKEEETTLADSLDPELAAKMAALFKK